VPIHSSEKRNKYQNAKWYISVYSSDMTHWSLYFNVKHQHLLSA